MTSPRASTKPTAYTSVLAKLQFSTEMPLPKGAKAQRSPRDVMIDALSEQIEISKARIEGGLYTKSKIKVVKDGEGNTVKTDVQSEPRSMFWKSASGAWMISLRYGGRVPVELSAGKPSVIVGPDIQDVATVLNAMREATQAGEFDEAINAAAEKARRKANSA